MPELRKDPVIGRWVIISTERGKRPSDFHHEKKTKKAGFCPFCEGNESKTPPEVLAYRDSGSDPNSPGWVVRVVPNKFPALEIEGDLGRRGDGMFDMMNGVGAHEVIIESPNHDMLLSQQPLEQLEKILWACKERMLDLKRDDRFRYTLTFKNQGEAAGASLEHSHMQMIATPIIPKRVQEELSEGQRYFVYKERCVFCDVVRQEISSGERIVAKNDAFVSFEPFAPRFPFETWLLPLEHGSVFEDIEHTEMGSFVAILKETLLRLDIALDEPPYNFILHTAPCRESDLEYYHWHLEITPRLTRVAGFEWGSGFYINPTPPEEAAQYLREIQAVAV